MEKIIYENEQSKLVAITEGGVVNLTQYVHGGDSSTVVLFEEEIKEVMAFMQEVSEQEETY